MRLDLYGKENVGALPERPAEPAWSGPFILVGPHRPASNTSNDSLSAEMRRHWVALQLSC